MDIKLKAAIKSDIDKVDAKLEKIVRPVSGLLYNVYKQVIDGGKRLRPLLVFYTSKALDFEKDDDALVVGSVIELVHTASLLHDDIIDEASFRRGRPSANSIFGIKPAVLGGDYLFSLAYNIVLKYDKEIARRISEAAYTLTEGEVLEIERAFNVDISKDDYLEVIYKKTGILIEVSCVCGALLAGGDYIDALSNYGKNLGLAFQIKDDCLDYMGDVKEVGKDLGIDLKEGKITLPVLNAIGKRGDLRNRLREFFNAKDEQLLSELILEVKEYGLDSALKEAKRYADLAKKAIDSLPDSKYKDYLLAIADYSVERAK